MPFKDATFNNPEPVCQWTPQRSKTLGARLIDAKQRGVARAKARTLKPVAQGKRRVLFLAR